MNEYQAKVEARRARLEGRAARLDAEAAAQWRKGDLREEVSGIPFGQPILVGHHSEGRHRRAIAKAHAACDRAVAAGKEAERIRDQLAGVGHAGISADDPEAADKLADKLAKAQADHAAMVAANKAAERGAAKPYAAYQLANSNGRMKQIKDRIAKLARDAARVPAAPIERDDGVRVVQNVDDNRFNAACKVAGGARPTAEQLTAAATPPN